MSGRKINVNKNKLKTQTCCSSSSSSLFPLFWLLDRALRLFWVRGEAQMYSKDPIKGQGHPGLIRPPLLPPPTPQFPPTPQSPRSPWHLKTCTHTSQLKNRNVALRSIYQPVLAHNAKHPPAPQPPHCTPSFREECSIPLGQHSLCRKKGHINREDEAMRTSSVQRRY